MIERAKARTAVPKSDPREDDSPGTQDTTGKNVVVTLHPKRAVLAACGKA